MNPDEFLSIEDKKDKYLFVGYNQITKYLLDNWLGDYKVKDKLPKGGLIHNNIVVRNDDLLSQSLQEIQRPYKFAVVADKVDNRRKMFKDAYVNTTDKKYLLKKIKKRTSYPEKLYNYCNDVAHIMNEVNKLKYMDNPDEYVKNLKIAGDKEIFKFLDKLFKGQNCLGNINEHPLKILYMVTNQLKGMIICKKCKDTYGLHPYRQKIFKKLNKNFTLQELLELLFKSTEIERMIKTGKIEPKIGLEYLVVITNEIY